MSEQLARRVDIEDEQDIVLVRRIVREHVRNLGFGVTDVTRIVTAASELARNIWVHAGSGTFEIEVSRGHGRSGVALTFADEGPGIVDVEQAMMPGFTTGRGLGLGLPGAKRLMDELVVESRPGGGTRVIARKWLHS